MKIIIDIDEEDYAVILANADIIKRKKHISPPPVPVAMLTVSPPMRLLSRELWGFFGALCEELVFFIPFSFFCSECWFKTYIFGL